MVIRNYRHRHRPVLAVVSVLVFLLSQAPTQGWVRRAQRPASSGVLYPVAAPDGGPVLLRDANRLMGWNGAGLRELTAVPPSVLGVYGIAFDAARERTVVLGLTNLVPATVGIVEWDGQTWSAIAPVVVNAPLVDVCFDPALGGVLVLTQPVFGTASQDYLWDGANWTSLPANVRPRHVGALTAADPARNRLVAFATNPTSGLAETHEWDGTSWSLRSPINSPAARTSPALAFDPVAGQVMLFGGLGAGGALQDGWHWDGTDWAPAAGAPPSPGVGPYPALVLDRSRGALVLLDLFGGDRDFVRSPTGWTNLFIEPGASSITVLDELRGSLVVHRNQQTYAWDGNDWALVATGGPSPRSSTGAFDLSRAALTVFGGLGPNQQVLGDTWSFDGSQWSQQVTTVAPSARAEHALVMDASSVSVILFGGIDGAAIAQSDTWQFRNGVWTDLSPGLTTTPAAGGCWGASRLSQDPAVVSGSLLWRWNGGWNAVATTPGTGGPTAFRVTSVGFTPADTILVTGSSGGVAETHELVNSTWIQQAPQREHVRQLSIDPLRGNAIGFGSGEMFALTATPAGNETIGAGCGVSVPEVYSEGFPRLGNAAHRVHADGLHGLVLFAIASNTVTTPLGGGCDLHLANPVTAAIVNANAFGIASLSMPIPNASWLRGVNLFVQAAGPQPGGPYLGFAVSAGLRIRIGE